MAGGTVRRCGTGWSIDFMIRYHRFRERVYVATKREAELHLARRLSEEARRLGSRRRSTLAPITLGEAINLWISEQSIDPGVALRARRFVDWYGEGKAMAWVEPYDVCAFTSTRTVKVKASTARRELSTLSAMFDWALRRGSITTNAVKVAPKPPARYTPPNSLSRVEMSSVLEAVVGHPILEPAYRLALFAGLRRGEISAARWEHVDLEAKTIHVPRGKTPGSRATLPLLPPLHEWLKENRPEAGVGPIIGGRRGSGVKPNALQVAVDRWNADVGIEPSKVPPHTPKNVPGSKNFCPWKNVRDGIRLPRAVTIPNLHRCRHTAATVLIQAGVPIHVVARFMRHSSTKMIEQVYGHYGAVEFRGVLEGGFDGIR